MLHFEHTGFKELQDADRSVKNVAAVSVSPAVLFVKLQLLSFFKKNNKFYCIRSECKEIIIHILFAYCPCTFRFYFVYLRQTMVCKSGHFSAVLPTLLQAIHICF